jgi:hypothetical protein
MFTEHGVIMAASVLNSPVAIEANILVVRVFVKLRNVLEAHRELAKKIEELEIIPIVFQKWSDYVSSF